MQSRSAKEPLPLHLSDNGFLLVRSGGRTRSPHARLRRRPTHHHGSRGLPLEGSVARITCHAERRWSRAVRRESKSKHPENVQLATVSQGVSIRSFLFAVLMRVIRENSLGRHGELADSRDPSTSRRRAAQRRCAHDDRGIICRRDYCLLAGLAKTGLSGLPHSTQSAFRRGVINPHEGHILCDP